MPILSIAVGGTPEGASEAIGWKSVLIIHAMA